MLENIDDLIEINLKLLAESKDKYLFIFDFVGEGVEYNEKRFADILEQNGIIDIHFNGERCDLTEFGHTIYESGGWKRYLEHKKGQEILQKEKDDLEFKKSKVDLELAEKMLKEYPKTKWFARIGLFIGIGLALLEFAKFLIPILFSDKI